MLRDLRQQILQIFVDLQLVRLGSFHQTVDDRAGLGTVDGVNDMPVCPANGERADGPFRCRIVNGDIAVLQKYTQILLLVQAVS